MKPPTLQELPTHLATLDQAQWASLFALLPAMDAIRHQGNGWTHAYGDTLTRFHGLVYSLGLITAFDWGAWKEGQDRLGNTQFDYNGLSMVELCQMITLICRADRFNESLLERTFQQGIMWKILSALEASVLKATKPLD